MTTEPSGKSFTQTVDLSKTIFAPHPIPEGEPPRVIENASRHIAGYVCVTAELQAFIEAKDTEIASLKAFKTAAQELLAKLSANSSAQSRERVRMMADHENELATYVDAYRTEHRAFIKATAIIADLQAEITRLTSQQNSAEPAKAEFPAFNSAQWKPPMS